MCPEDAVAGSDSRQGSFFGVRIRFLASEGGSLHKYTNQSQSLRILQPEKRTLTPGRWAEQKHQNSTKQCECHHDIKARVGISIGVYLP
jgi:hypothetical protein